MPQLLPLVGMNFSHVTSESWRSGTPSRCLRFLPLLLLVGLIYISFLLHQLIYCKFPRHDLSCSWDDHLFLDGGRTGLRMLGFRQTFLVFLFVLV